MAIFRPKCGRDDDDKRLHDAGNRTGKHYSAMAHAYYTLKWKPHPGPQSDFIQKDNRHNADRLFFGMDYGYNKVTVPILILFKGDSE